MFSGEEGGELAVPQVTTEVGGTLQAPPLPSTGKQSSQPITHGGPCPHPTPGTQEHATLHSKGTVIWEISLDHLGCPM